MNTAHTPGPWFIGMRSGANSNVIYAHDGKDQFYDTSVCSVYGLFLNTDIENQKDGEGLANARLIAAAPDLLAALKNFVDGCSVNVNAVEVARAAIAKAVQA